MAYKYEQNQQLRKAKDLHRKLAALEADRAASRLSAPAFVAAACAMAKCTEARLDALEAALAERSGQLDELRRCLWRLERHVPEISRPHTRINHLFDSMGDAQLAAIRADRFEAFALASRTVARRSPEAFGTATEIGAAEAERARLEGELEAACGVLLRSLQLGRDLVVTPLKSPPGAVVMTFVLAPGLAFMGDVASVRRLIEHLVAEEAREAAA